MNLEWISTPDASIQRQTLATEHLRWSAVSGTFPLRYLINALSAEVLACSSLKEDVGVSTARRLLKRTDVARTGGALPQLHSTTRTVAQLSRAPTPTGPTPTAPCGMPPAQVVRCPPNSDAAESTPLFCTSRGRLAYASTNMERSHAPYTCCDVTRVSQRLWPIATERDWTSSE
jgi:hypothetical protein